MDSPQTEERAGPSNVSLGDGPFLGMHLTGVAYVSSNRSTHSDLMSTITSLVAPTDTRDVPFFGQDPTKRGEIKRVGKAGPISLSIPASKLNRELALERKLFLERLHGERVFRAQVEEGAATMVQAMVRSKLARQHLARRNRNQEEEDEGEENIAPSRTGGLTRKRPRTALHELGDDEEDVYFSRLKEENRIRKYLSSMRRHTSRAMTDAPPLDKRLRTLFNRHRLLQDRSKKARPYGTKNRKKLNRMALRIQCCVRKYIARRHVRVALMYRREECEREAAVVIQKRYRSHRHREQGKNREINEMTHAAISIQKNIRRALDVRFAKLVRAHFARAAAEIDGASKVQRMLRKKIAKQRMARKRMEKNAVKLQATYRGHKVRAAAESEKRQRSEVAVKLQSLHRGRVGRRAFEDKLDERRKEHNAAATKVQTIVRSNSARKLVQHKREERSATRIQSKVRQRAASKVAASKAKTKRECAAATKIQARVRSKQGQKRASLHKVHREQEKAAVRIQCAHRTKHARKQVSERRHKKKVQAATKIQSKRRQQKAKQAVQSKRENFAAMRIQRSYRAGSARSLLQEERESFNERLQQEAEAVVSESMSGHTVRRASRDSNKP